MAYALLIGAFLTAIAADAFVITQPGINSTTACLDIVAVVLGAFGAGMVFQGILDGRR
jgi:hypothetical protein